MSIAWSLNWVQQLPYAAENLEGSWRATSP